MNNPEIPPWDKAANYKIPLERENNFQIINQSLSKIYYFDASSMEKEANLRDLILQEKYKGNCYLLSYFFCLANNNYQMVQGVCDNIKHSWCEKGNFVYDPSLNETTTRHLFYKKNKINSDNVFHYSIDKATENIAKYGGLGHWSDITKSEENINPRNIPLQNCFSILKNNFNKLEKFSWFRTTEDYWKLTLKLQNQEEMIFIHY